MQSGKVKVSQTGNAVWSQVDNSVSIGRYKQGDAAADSSARTRLSEQSPETQTESGREEERDKKRERGNGNMEETEENKERKR